MNLRQITIGTLVGAVALFVVGFLIYGMLGGAEMIYDGSGAGLKGDYNLGIIALTDLITALLLSIIYSHWAGIKTFMTGLKNGAWIGAILGLIVMLDYFSATNLVTMNGVLFYAATHAARTAIAGGLIGWAMGRFE